MWFKCKRQEPLRSVDDLVARVEQYGFLPFFKWAGNGFSVQEMTDPQLFFVKDVEGPWEWKGPAIRTGRVAYGSIFNGKAGYVSLEMLPDFVNWRRASRKLSNAEFDESMPLSEHNLLDIISINESLLSSELKELLGMGRRRRRTASDLVDITGLDTVSFRRKASGQVDRMLTSLQMQTRIVIADFEYAVSRQGKTYGWGLARYTTPESLYGPEAIEVPGDRQPEESLSRMCRALRRRSSLSSALVRHLLK